MYDTDGPYQVFLRYWLGKYRENTNRYHTEIPNRDTTLLFTGSLAGIRKLPALAGWYIRYGMYGIFCTVRFGGSSIL